MNGHHTSPEKFLYNIYNRQLNNKICVFHQQFLKPWWQVCGTLQCHAQNLLLCLTKTAYYCFTAATLWHLTQLKKNQQ